MSSLYLLIVCLDSYPLPNMKIVTSMMDSLKYQAIFGQNWDAFIVKTEA